MITQFLVDQPLPDCVIELEPTGDYYEDMDLYGVMVGDCLEFVRHGDWIVQDEQGRVSVVRAAAVVSL